MAEVILSLSFGGLIWLVGARDCGLLWLLGGAAQLIWWIWWRYTASLPRVRVTPTMYRPMKLDWGWMLLFLGLVPDPVVVFVIGLAVAALGSVSPMSLANPIVHALGYKIYKIVVDNEPLYVISRISTPTFVMDLVRIGERVYKRRG